MPTLSTSLSGSLIVPNATKNRTISDANLQDLLNWAAVAFDSYIQTTFNPTKTPGFTPTNAQILSAWDQAHISATMDAVKKFKQDAAAQTAVNSTTGISIT